MRFIGIWVYNLLIYLLNVFFFHEIVLYCPQKLFTFLLVNYGLVLFVDYLPIFLHFVDFELVSLAQRVASQLLLFCEFVHPLMSGASIIGM
jgi:hypothetical protein